MSNKLAEAYVQVGADMRPMEAAFKSIRGGLNRLASMRFNLPGGGILGKSAESMFGARQIFSGFSSFKDSVTTSGGSNDPASKQLSELQKSNTTLRELVQTIRERTYPTIAM